MSPPSRRAGPEATSLSQGNPVTGARRPYVGTSHSQSKQKGKHLLVPPLAKTACKPSSVLWITAVYSLSLLPAASRAVIIHLVLPTESGPRLIRGDVAIGIQRPTRGYGLGTLNSLY